MADNLLVILSLFSFLTLGASFEVSDKDNYYCEDACQSKVLQPEACKRGCRFFSLIYLINDFPDLNDTLTACKSSCDEAHLSPEFRASCITGCQIQLPQSLACRRRMEALKEPLDYYMSPLLYVNKMYSNMVEKVHSQVSVSWSFYVQSDKGALVVVRSEPVLFDSDFDEDQTPNYIETNLEENDFLATSDVKNSQLRVDWHRGDIEMAPGDADWLSCLSRRTMLPRYLLFIFIFCCFTSIIWLCLSSCISSDQQYPDALSKWSINTDLGYLQSTSDPDLYIVKTKVQDLGVEAAHLPIKIKIDSV